VIHERIDRPFWTTIQNPHEKVWIIRVPGMLILPTNTSKLRSIVCAENAKRTGAGCEFDFLLVWRQAGRQTLSSGCLHSEFLSKHVLIWPAAVKLESRCCCLLSRMDPFNPINAKTVNPGAWTTSPKTPVFMFLSTVFHVCDCFHT